MRNGAVAATSPVRDTTIPQLVRLMVGRDLHGDDLAPAPARAGSELLRVEGLRYRGNPHAVDLALAEGEILGIAGLMGSGRTETVRALFGADPRDGGRIWLRGEEVTINSPADAVRAGICLLTEDRKGQGLMLSMSGAANVSITDLPSVSRRGLLDRPAERVVADRYRDELGIRAPSVDTVVGLLSGGNQQKYVLAKWLFRGAAVLVLDEPTRGIDVGAKFEIYAVLRALAAQGRGLIVVSSDLPELLLLCHRIAVFSRGRISGQLDRDDFDQESILTLAYEGYSPTATATATATTTASEVAS
jgi:ribose transport system ATP-binding protein